MTRKSAARQVGRMGVASSALVALVLTLTACDVGKVDFQYRGASAPTGEKPQSKLWYAGGLWWGSLYDETSTDFRIFRYDWAADSWSNTGVLIDERASAAMDTYWDGTHLYVVTAGPTETTSSHSPRVARYTYLADQRSWALDSGFPVTIGSGGVEAAVIAKDSKGLVWVTYTQGAKVWVSRSTPGKVAWTKFQLPTPNGESNVTADDISAIVAYDGNKLGVMWSNELNGILYFATHVDGQPDGAWTITRAYDRPKGADDHINLKSVVGDPAGRVFAAVKTSSTVSTDPLVHLLVLRPDTTWASTTFGTVADNHTRAIVALDTQNREVYLFAGSPCCSGGKIYYKKTSMDAPSFAPGLGTEFIGSDTHKNLNNPTSTKQNLNSGTGLLLMAGDDRTSTYMHNRLALTR